MGMKYMLYEENTDLDIKLVYCDDAESTNNDCDCLKILESFNFMGSWKLFNNDVASRYESSREIKNFKNLYYSEDGICQVMCGLVTDYNGVTIPHLFKVRKIGVIFECED